MRIFLVVTMLGALTLPAYAQTANGIGGAQGAGRATQSKQETPEEAAKKKAEEKANERAFNDAVRRIPAPVKKYDPWGSVRSSSDAH
jgi:hypothetical protein